MLYTKKTLGDNDAPGWYIQWYFKLEYDYPEYSGPFETRSAAHRYLNQWKRGGNIFKFSGDARRAPPVPNWWEEHLEHHLPVWVDSLILNKDLALVVKFSSHVWVNNQGYHYTSTIKTETGLKRVATQVKRDILFFQHTREEYVISLFEKLIKDDVYSHLIGNSLELRWGQHWAHHDEAFRMAYNAAASWLRRKKWTQIDGGWLLPNKNDKVYFGINPEELYTFTVK